MTAGGVNKSASAKKAKSTPKKVKADVDSDDEETPVKTKKIKSTPKKVKANVDSDDEETPVKAKKARCKGKAKGKTKVKVEEEEEQAVKSVEGADGIAVKSGGAASESEQ